MNTPVWLILLYVSGMVAVWLGLTVLAIVIIQKRDNKKKND